MATLPAHKTSYRVLYSDTDAAGVVYYGNYLKFFEIGRTELMRDWVRSYKEIEKLGIVLPVTECFTRFKAPAHYDNIITIETTVADLRKYSCRFNYRLFRNDGEDERRTLLVKGYTVNASVDREGKLVVLPVEITCKLEELCKN